MIELRDYQRRAVDETLAALALGENPCLMLPTAGGKSLVLAELCRHFVSIGKRVLMLTHVKELIEQNSKELHGYWRELTGGQYAPLGIYSASIGKKQLGHSITYAGIQSIASRASDLVGLVDVVIVDESHLIPTKGEGRYRQVATALHGVPWIGLTATPWRLGHGKLTEGEGALFSKLVTPEGTSVREMVSNGHLSPLRSKHTGVQLLELVGGVRKNSGDYIESELDKAVNQDGPNGLIAREIFARGTAEDDGPARQHWLVFCVSIPHAQEMARVLTELGAPCGVVHANMTQLERVNVLTRFSVGELRALANVNILSTGWNFPNLDLIAFCRPTLSPVLYVQAAGRGMRLKSGLHRDCLVLDFAGLVKTHGPITDVKPPRAKGQSPGETPVKVCPGCSEIVLISVMLCPSCGHEWEAPKKEAKLHNDDIMGEHRRDGVAEVHSWNWHQHITRSDVKVLAVDYTLREPTYTKDEHGTEHRYSKVTIYWPVFTEEWAREKLKKLAEKLGVELTGSAAALCTRFNRIDGHMTIKVSVRKGWPRVKLQKYEPYRASDAAE